MGTEAFWIPAVISAVGAAGNAVNQSNANKREQNAEVVAQDNANNFRNQANNLVKQQTQKIATSNPAADAAQEQGNFVSQLRKNIGGTTASGDPTSALGPVAGASSRYNAGTKAASADTQNFGDTMAGNVSAVDAAVRQRQNEALQTQTLGTTLNGLNQQAMSQAFVDQLRAKAAGTPSPWVSMFSNILGQVGGSAAKNGWFTGGGNETPTIANSTQGLDSVANGLINNAPYYSPTWQGA